MDIVLKKEMEKSITETNFDNLYNEIAETAKTNLAKAYDLGYELLNKADKQGKKHFKYYLQLAVVCHRLVKSNEVEALVQKALEFSDIDNNSKAKALLLLAMSYYDMDKYTLAFEHAFGALEIADKDNNQDMVIKVLNNVGLIFFKLNDNFNAKEHIIKALNIARREKNKYLIAVTLNNLGLVCKMQKRYTEALGYYRNSLALKEELDDLYGLSNTLNNMGIIFNVMKEYKKALACYFRVLEIKNKISDTRGIASVLNCMADVYIEINELDSAFSCLERCQNIIKNIENSEALLNNLKSYANYYEKKKDYKNAFETGKKVYDLERKFIDQTKEYKKNSVYSDHLFFSHDSNEIQALLLNISSAVTTCSTLEELYTAIHNQLSRVIDTTNFYIALYNKELGTISSPYYVDEFKKHTKSLQKVESEFTKLVINSGRSYLITDTLRKELVKKGTIKQFDWKSKVWVGIPLKVKNEIIGAIAIQSYENSEQFTYSDMRLLEFVSEQIAIAIAHKRSEERIAYERKAYKNFVESMQDWVAEIDLEGRFIETNSMVELILGYTKREILGKHTFDFWPPNEYIEADIDEYYEDLKQGKGWRGFKLALMHKNAFVQYVSSTAIPIFDSNNKLIKYRMIYSDINEKIKSEKEMKLLNTALKQANELIILTNDIGEIRYVNPAFCKKSGYKPKDVKGKNISMLDFSFDEDEIISLLSRLSIQKKPWNGYLLMKSIGGETIETEASISPIRTGGSEVSNFVILMRDVRQVKVLETQLRQAQKMEAIGTMAGGIAHDFNNILSAIIGFTELAEVKHEGSLDVTKELNGIIDASERAKALVKQILTVSRKTENTKTVLQVGLIVKEALKMMRASIPTNIELCYNNIDTEHCVLANPTEIHQIIMNLVINASHAVCPIDGKISISLNLINPATVNTSSFKLDLNKNYLHLKVCDNGKGMPLEVQQRIFEPYFTTKAQGEGTGMGLAITHGIIKNYGGEVKVSSVVNKGTTFDIYLPIKEDCRKKSTEITNDTTQTYSKAKIMYVDDEEAIVEFSTNLLQHYGYKVDAFTNSKTALSHYKHNSDKYDMIITDLTMPNLNGLDFGKEVLKINNAQKIILCTGYNQKLTLKSVEELGFSYLVNKPVRYKKLIELIEKFIN